MQDYLLLYILPIVYVTKWKSHWFNFPRKLFLHTAIGSLGVDHCVGEVGSLVRYTFQFSETVFWKQIIVPLPFCIHFWAETVLENLVTSFLLLPDKWVFRKKNSKTGLGNSFPKIKTANIKGNYTKHALELFASTPQILATKNLSGTLLKASEKKLFNRNFQ